MIWLLFIYLLLGFDGPAPKIDFIPSSRTSSSEFNIIASVSKAARATKELNATIASK